VLAFKIRKTVYQECDDSRSLTVERAIIHVDEELALSRLGTAEDIDGHEVWTFGIGDDHIVSLAQRDISHKAVFLVFIMTYASQLLAKNSCINYYLFLTTVGN